MNKTIFAMLCTLALITGCNQSQKQEPEVVHETTVVKEVEKPQPEPGVKSVEVNPNGVSVNVQDKHGNTIEINKERR